MVKKTIFGLFGIFWTPRGQKMSEMIISDIFYPRGVQNIPKQPKNGLFWLCSIHIGYIGLCSQNVQNMAKKDHFGLFWDILDSSPGQKMSEISISDIFYPGGVKNIPKYPKNGIVLSKTYRGRPFKRKISLALKWPLSVRFA